MSDLASIETKENENQIDALVWTESGTTVSTDVTQGGSPVKKVHPRVEHPVRAVSRRPVSTSYKKESDDSKLPVIYGQSSYCCGCCGRTNNKRMPGSARRAICFGFIFLAVVAGATLVEWRKGNDGGKADKYPTANTKPDFKPSVAPTFGPSKAPTIKPTSLPTTEKMSRKPSQMPTIRGPTVSPSRGNVVYNPPGSVVDRFGALEVREDSASGQMKIFSTKTNEPVQLKGPSFFWSNNMWGGEPFYNLAVVDYMVSNWTVTVIRAAMGVEDAGGYIQDPVANEDRVDVLVEAALEFGIYVIIDWHSHSAGNHRAEAMRFFTNMVAKYGDYPNVIFELWNEPITETWEDDVKPYLTAVLEIIRRTGNDNLCLLGSPTWTQDIHIASASPIVGYENIAYTIHFYSRSHRQFLRDRVDTALANGVAVFASEWSSVLASGNGEPDVAETKVWLDFLDERDISSCMWALNDKDEGSSFLELGTSPDAKTWTDDVFTANGLIARSIFTNTFDDDYAALFSN